MESLRRCSSCEVPKPIIEFSGHKAYCRPCYNAWRREWRRNNLDKVAAQMARGEARDPGRRQRYDRTSYQKNREKRIAKARRWNVANRQLVAAREAARRAAQRQAVPLWANKQAILALYERAALEGKQVDHIVPLQSAIVCGLHCEANLQLLDPRENISKGNRHWPDMPIR